MNIAYRWLQDYVKTTTPPEVLGEKFRMTSSEMESLSAGFRFPENVVVGYVKTLTQHPNADRLRVATVDTGDKIRTIVCGAPNIAQGQTVIVALPDAILTPLVGGPVTISTASLRGVVSEGMICSPAELGLPISSNGVLVLDSPKKPGTPAVIALELNDAVLDLEITPNRPDLLSYYGLAREVSAFEKRSLLDVAIASIEQHDPRYTAIEAKIEDSKLSSRYSALLVEIDTTPTTPWWMQARLLLAGMRPVTAVVDIANYVMLELGQPLHTFDFDTLAHPKKRNMPLLTVRSAKTNEQISLLDGTTRTLEKEDIVIADADNVAIALAGIMGGQTSEIKEGTRRILIESATFAKSSIRRTSRRLGLRSEASLRFEKGLDSELTVTALKRYLYLLQQICEARPASAIEDICRRAQSGDRPRIHVTFNQIQQILGVHISAPECKSILHKLGFQLPAFTKSGFEAIPPSWRSDVECPEDIVEEIVRIWGYERVPQTLPSGPIIPPQRNVRFEQRKRIRHILAQRGAYETISQPFIAKQALELINFPVEKALILQNPLSREGEYLAPTHLVQLLANISTVNRQVVPLTLFEIGTVFSHPQMEKEMLSLLMRNSQTSDHTVGEMKAHIERILIAAGLSSSLEYRPADTYPTYFAPEASIAIYSNTGRLIGYLGAIRPSIISAHKIRSGKAILFAELSFSALLEQDRHNNFYTPAPKYPAIERDITLLVDADLAYQRAEEVLKKAMTELLNHWSLTDVYTGKPLPSDKKSYTFHLTFLSPDRTLTDAEVQTELTHIVELLRKELKADITL